MSRGPIDFVMVRFAEPGVSPQIADALKSLIDAGTIRIIDLMFVTRESKDSVIVTELGDLADDDYNLWNSIVDEVNGLLTEEDAVLLSEQLETESSAVLVLYENSWAREMNRLIAEANGEVLFSDRIPRAVIDELLPA